MNNMCPLTHKGKKIERALSETEKAYFAGFIDGEGCVSFAWRKKYITPIIQITNTDYSVLVDFFNVYGGSVRSRNEIRPNRKDCYAWVVCGQKALKVVTDVLPYLRIKKPQAELLLSLKRYSPTAERDKLGRLKGIFTPEIEAENRMLVDEIRKLNKRGRITV